MPYNDHLANRVREALASLPNLDERPKMGGLSFMIEDKLVVHVQDDELMIRCDKARTDELLDWPGARPYTMKGKGALKGWLLIDSPGTTRQADLMNWLTITLSATAEAKVSRKRQG
ncbi:TfoX/Sxy family protein [Larkinella soli]|uniref:TfoX/Sxy family protein n=1 Tax=Larkinella soli TaxID=1770527 RepID=UPI000FFB5ABF|nr:TfoX/Sxy family protein [Larkinella soli]